MPQILIDRKTCSKCNTCATVCVMGIIDKSTALNHPTIPEEKLDYCLKCGFSFPLITSSMSLLSDCKNSFNS